MADDQPTREHPPTEETVSDAPPAGGQSPLSVGSDDDPFAERPEAFVGAAFAGGLALAIILRRFTR
jgi:hypothetical protein